jgi:hypothetical protein
MMTEALQKNSMMMIIAENKGRYSRDRKTRGIQEWLKKKRIEGMSEPDSGAKPKRSRNVTANLGKESW